MQLINNIQELFVNVKKFFLVLGSLIMTVSVGGNPMAVLSPTPTPTETPEATTTSNVNVVLQAKTESQSTSLLSDFIYPGSNVLSQSDNNIKMESSNSPDTVTEYYKSKITALKPSTKAFALTNTNGVILNKLAFAVDGRQLTVEVKSDNSENKSTQINVSLDNN